MSGGSWNYAFHKLEEIADSLEHTSLRKSCRDERIALGKLVRKIAQAMHDIEWVDSCDYGDGDEREAIMKCITLNDVLQSAEANLRAEFERVQELLKRLEAKQ